MATLLRPASDWKCFNPNYLPLTIVATHYKSRYEWISLFDALLYKRDCVVLEGDDFYTITNEDRKRYRCDWFAAILPLSLYETCLFWHKIPALFNHGKEENIYFRDTVGQLIYHSIHYDSRYEQKGISKSFIDGYRRAIGHTVYRKIAPPKEYDFLSIELDETAPAAIMLQYAAKLEKKGIRAYSKYSDDHTGRMRWPLLEDFLPHDWVYA